MKITITGSLGNISHRLVTNLIAKGHTVTVISHNPERAAAITQLGAIPAIGSIENKDFLLQAFEQANAVYTMIPPNYASTNIIEYMKTAGDHYAAAIAQTGISHVVNLSSIGAHLPDSLGPTSANYYVENKLNTLTDVNVLHLRPGMFYTNFFGAIPMIRYQHIIGNNFDGTVNMALSHPQDIADVASEALDTLSFTGKTFHYIVSDEKTGGEIAATLGKAIGAPDLTWVTFSDEELLQGLLQTGMTKEMARVYIIEIGIALRKGNLLEHYHQHTATGKIRFDQFAQEFAQVYHQ